MCDQDLLLEVAILSDSSRVASLAAGIKAASRDAQSLTDSAYGIARTKLFDQVEPYPCRSEKIAKAFFRMSRSSRVRDSSF